ncbi:hypothetical protein V502_02329 [Pseudogymnoascus sp. VKM F-4520 (FW-2644)]|nr:hypothetical protein V502_02329 [Pseudogymnoascus sp. VKM F-4520 (FW-2644)]
MDISNALESEGAKEAETVLGLVEAERTVEVETEGNSDDTLGVGKLALRLTDQLLRFHGCCNSCHVQTAQKHAKEHDIHHSLSSYMSLAKDSPVYGDGYPIALLNAASNAPESNSINAIIREHYRRRLYVQPALWTPKQPELLGCKFASKIIPPGRRCKKKKPAKLVDVDFPSLSKETGAIYGHAVRAAAQLRKSCTLEATDSAIRQLLAACKIEYLGSHELLSFQFGHHVIDLRTDGLFASTCTTPSLAYINLDAFHSFRNECIRRKFLGRSAHRRKGTQNSPVARLIDKTRRCLQPEKEAEEPYIVAVLIALAQQQRRQHQQRKNRFGGSGEISSARQSNVYAIPRPGEQDNPLFSKSFKVRLLAVTGTIAPKLYLYAARIPSQFLDKFDLPSKSSPSGPISISYYSVPLPNPGKLPKKLYCALRAPIE